jgi:hypothetical protein
MLRLNAKAYNAFLPPELHAAIRKDAKAMAEAAGGQVNINKVLVEQLFEQYRGRLEPAEQAAIEEFLGNL